MSIDKIDSEDIFLRAQLFRVRDEMKMNNQLLAKTLNVSPSAISMIEAGKRRVGRKIISSLQRRMCVNPTWLATGKGSMFLGDKPLEPIGEVPEGFILVPRYDVIPVASLVGADMTTEKLFTFFIGTMEKKLAVRQDMAVDPLNDGLHAVYGELIAHLLAAKREINKRSALNELVEYLKQAVENNACSPATADEIRRNLAY